MGIIAAIIAMLVIRIGLMRVCAPWIAATFEALPVRRYSSAKMTSKIALATATPMAMMAPMKDWIFKVVLVSRRAKITPQITAGTVERTTRANRMDWKLAASSR